MVVHFPIALLPAAVLFDVLARRWRRDENRVASLYALVLGTAGALIAVISGHMAEEAVEHSGIPESVLEIHEKLGFVTFWIFSGLLGLRVAEGLGWITQRPALRIGLGLVSVSILFTASYYGGSLVYDYGAGVTLPR
jgi:uncharacterized membrane protein